MERPLVLAVTVTAYDSKNAVFKAFGPNNKARNYTRSEMHDLLSLLGQEKEWGDLPCACEDPRDDHCDPKEEIKAEANAIRDEFVHHTTAFKHAFWEKLSNEDLDVGAFTAWIAAVHPILCCAERHQDREAMLGFDNCLEEE